jgi:hypothetical protein
MKIQTKSSLNHFRIFLAASLRRRRRYLARFMGGGIVMALLTGSSTGYGRENINWSFTGLGSNAGGSTTNGVPVSDFDSGTLPLEGTFNGTVSAALCQSDLSVSWTGATTYGGYYTSASSLLDLWVYNQPGQIGPITITITPYVFVRSWEATPTPPGDLLATSEVNFYVSIYRDLAFYANLQYDTLLSGRGNEGVTVPINLMAPYTLYVEDGEQVTLEMGHTDTVSVNSWLSANAASVAWYTVSVSPNGYLSTGPRYPANPPVPILPPIRPQTTSAAFTDGSHTQMTVSGIGGPTIAPLPYLVMTTTNLALPLASWSPYLTNHFAENGTFSYSFPVNAGEPQRFFQLQMAQ